MGGPFIPASCVYTLTNSGGASLNWTITWSQTWLSLSATDGDLAPGASTNITLSINSSANNLAHGSYQDSLSFANITTGAGDTQRGVTLQVAPIMVSISLAEKGPDYFRIGFQGYPSRSYAILVSSNLASWDVVETVTAGVDGKVVYDAPASTSATNMFYRVRLAD